MIKKLVYIIVLNYRSLEDTLGCIESIRKIDYVNIRLLVVDNDSGDGSGEKLRELLSEPEVIQLQSNKGYAGGNNEGISHALKEGADYVLIVNPDVRVLPESIATYTDVMEADVTVGALSPIQLTADETSLDPRFKRGIFESQGLPVPELFFDNTLKWEVKTLYGAALMVSRSVIEKVGGFDPLYFAYGEDDDFCRRIRVNGFRLIVTAGSPVRHLRTHEDQNRDDFRSFLRLKGRYLYKLKNPELSFTASVKKSLYDLVFDIKNRSYLYDHYKLVDYIRMISWIIRHIDDIKRHRRLEKSGRAYI